MRSKIKVLAVLFLATFTLFTGCTKKEKPASPADTAKKATETVKPDTAAKDTATADTAKAKEISLLGTWQGTLANYSATLKITNQDGKQFTGSIVVNYRNVATHSVVGSVDPETGAFSMSDNDQTRSSGNYTGVVAKSGRSITGSFTEKRAGGITVNFSFNK